MHENSCGKWVLWVLPSPARVSWHLRTWGATHFESLSQTWKAKLLHRFSVGRCSFWPCWHLAQNNHCCAESFRPNELLDPPSWDLEPWVFKILRATSAPRWLNERQETAAGSHGVISHSLALVHLWHKIMQFWRTTVSQFHTKFQNSRAEWPAQAKILSMGRRHVRKPSRSENFRSQHPLPRSLAEGTCTELFQTTMVANESNIHRTPWHSDCIAHCTGFNEMESIIYIYKCKIILYDMQSSVCIPQNWMGTWIDGDISAPKLPQWASMLWSRWSGRKPWRWGSAIQMCRDSGKSRKSLDMMGCSLAWYSRMAWRNVFESHCSSVSVGGSTCGLTKILAPKPFEIEVKHASYAQTLDELWKLSSFSFWISLNKSMDTNRWKCMMTWCLVLGVLRLQS